MGDFGEKFRKAREAKSLSFDDVSHVTKISSRMLQAIEQENFDLLPGGVFNKGFIRAYAKHLGLDGEEAVTDYLTALRQAQVDAHEVWDPVPPKPAAAPQRPAVPERRPLAPYRKPTLKAQPPTQVEELPELQLPRAEDVRPPRSKFLTDRGPAIPWRIVAVVAVILILASVLWTRHSRSTRTQAATATPTAPTTQTSSSTTASSPAAMNASTQPTTPAPAPQSPAPAAQTKQATQPVPTPHIPNEPAKPQAAPTDANKVVTTKDADKNKDANKEDNNREPDVITRTFPAAKSAASSQTAAAPMTLVIRATETSWISVTADDQPASHETLIAPAHTSIRATRQIVAKIGNAAGVTFLWNGQEIPAQGAEAEVKTFVFDASGMRVLP